MSTTSDLLTHMEKEEMNRNIKKKTGASGKLHAVWGQEQCEVHIVTSVSLTHSIKTFVQMYSPLNMCESRKDIPTDSVRVES